MTVEYTDADQAVLPQLQAYLSNGRNIVIEFFGTDYLQPFTVRLFPNRSTMTAYWREEWGIPELETQCWMVASGTASTLSLLSPRAWKTDACEHEANDTVRTQLVIAHEMAHTFHGQYNPQPDFDGLDSIGWFIEGLAVYASGQLDYEYLASAKDAVADGATPSQLEEAWSGKYRYGISGSLMQYIDQRYGREMILSLLPATSEAAILEKLGIGEERLLADWEEWVGRQSAAPRS